MCNKISPDSDRTLVAIYRDGNWRIANHFEIRAGDQLIYLERELAWTVLSVDDFDGFNKKMVMTLIETSRLT